METTATALRLSPSNVCLPSRTLVDEESPPAMLHTAIRQRTFPESITALLKKFTNQRLTSAEVIAELVEIFKQVAAEINRGKLFPPPLNGDELVFHDAVALNGSAVEVQREAILVEISRQIVGLVRRDARIDWGVRAAVRANLCSSVKQLPTLNDYPPDKQPEAIKLVIEQMESLAVRVNA